MSVGLLPIIPPAPKVHAAELSGWRAFWSGSRNSLATWSTAAFDELIQRRKLFGIDYLLVSEPEAVRHVLTTAAARYERILAARRIVGPLTGPGVVLAEGAEWRRQRRMLAPVFTPARVGHLLAHFSAAAGDLIRRLEASPRGANLSAAYQEATLEAVLRALFSLPDSERRARFAGMVRGYLAGPGRMQVLDALAPTEESFAFATGGRRRFQRTWFAAIDELIAERRRLTRSEVQRDLLDLLLAARDPETGDALADAEVRAQSATMLFGGFETTSRLLFWATYLLVLDRAEQSRLRQEVAAFPPERVTTPDDLLHWPRLNQTLLEALRLYPPIAHLTRVAIAEDVVAGEKVEVGTQVWISPWVIHRHRKLWEQPTAFMPDRFSDKRSPWTSGAPFLPFGAGPRICIGATFAMAEAQIMLATLLARFHISLDDARPVLPVANPVTAPSFEPIFRLERV